MPPESASQGLREHRPPRACQSCHTAKVRCRRTANDQPCVRCSLSGRPCIRIENSNKRQKRNDGRSLSEIESSLAALTEILQPRDRDTSSGQHVITPASTTEPNVARSIYELFDQETASLIFEHFTENMLQHFPFMIFGLEATAADVLKDTPILFLAIMDAASDGFCETDTSRKLRRLLVRTYSSTLLETRRHDVSLLQAYVVTVIWHRDSEPSQSGQQLNAFQLSHAAANTAMTMDLGKRLKEWSGMASIPIRLHGTQNPACDYQVGSLEVRRIWLACYYICSHTSLASRAPNILRWSRNMDESLEVLGKSLAGSPSDKVLCAYVRLQHIVEDTEAQISASVPSSTATGIAYRAAKRQLAEWASTSHVWNDQLALSYQFAELYLHETAMTSDLSAKQRDNVRVDTITVNPTEFQDCLSAAHTLLDTFLSVEITLIRTLPTVYFVQFTHAAIVLAKLHFAAARAFVATEAASRISALGVEDYLERVVQKFSGWGALWPLQKLSDTFKRLQQLLRQCGVSESASVAWLDVWILESTTSVPNDARAIVGEGVPEDQPEYIADEAMLSVANDDVLVWAQAGSKHSILNDELPSASLDATQLVDWFGTDLDTSTFDFDGNLQLMIPFFD
ncbi:hypothetical protein E4T38_01361 [Aureobasidium subglaciale]|nr:hypothetical protein E4T38_01361 [Aureobasidium subglaciale]KAI5229746.1 hypothetical protein E4T40_01362 [Aureobasidium subglaciale]KAI5233338.1 hypothetical protein E4T41_01360 [Aureobasidium subglaciale]KAI5266724.1 hypothetical protein E4T46_01361 [Aureobasidium subglaciale]